MAASEIRDEKLYRSEFDTFEEYCLKRWNMSKRHANRLVSASNVINNLTPVGVNNIPQSERVTRPLTQLEPEQQKEAWYGMVRYVNGYIRTHFLT